MDIKPPVPASRGDGIPAGWNVAKLSALCSMKSGEAITAEQIDTHSAYPCYGGNGLRGYTTRFTHEGEFALIGRQGALCGNVVGVNGKFFASEHAVVVTPHASVDVCWLTYALARMELNHYSESSAQPGLSVAKVLDLPVCVPSRNAEQRAIAMVLSDVDALIGALDKMIAKKRDLKQAAMQQLLAGQTRLPGFSEDWELKRLDELADIRSGGTPSTVVARFWDGVIPWCTPTDITQLNGAKYLTKTARTITQEGLDSSSAELVPSQSVVMTSRATIGECAINTVPVATNQGFKNFVPFDSTSAEYLYYVLQTQKQGFIRLCAGSTFLEIGKGQLAGYEIRVPPTRDEQVRIATAFSEMDAELSALKARRDKTHALKQGMMQELLTGRIRLPAG